MASGASVLPFSRRREPRVEVRPARAGEPVSRTLDDAGFGPHVARLLGYPRDSPHGEVLVAAGQRGRLLGGACTAGFGATGWIGALGVLPRARRQGVGELLTRAAIEWLHEHGAETVLLYATDMGRPVYERVGFEREAPARAWRGAPPVGAIPPGIRRLRPSDREPMLALDRLATGEDRRPVLDMLPALLGLAYERDGALAGYALQTPWGAGPAVLALDEEAGVALLRGLALEPQPITITVPDDNAACAHVLRSWGFQRVNTALRMRYGPPVVGHDPTKVFGLFNLFWG